MHFTSLIHTLLPILREPVSILAYVTIPRVIRAFLTIRQTGCLYTTQLIDWQVVARTTLLTSLRWLCTLSTGLYLACISNTRISIILIKPVSRQTLSANRAIIWIALEAVSCVFKATTWWIHNTYLVEGVVYLAKLKAWCTLCLS